MAHSHHPFSGGSPESIRAGHELTDVQVAPLVQFGVMLGVLIALTMWGMYEMHGSLESYFAEREAPLHPMRSAGPVGAGPRLQANELADYRVYAARQQADTASDGAYMWIDKSTEVVRVPIARAMELVLEQGLPHRAANK